MSINGLDVTLKPFSEVVDIMARSSGYVDMVFAPADVAFANARPVSSISSERSKALPWAKVPASLASDAAIGNPGGIGGALSGNQGFDPLQISSGAQGSSARRRLLDLRDAELKHARLAMVAAVGWPAAEAWDCEIADYLGLPSVVAQTGGLSPSLLNGGLISAVNPYFWAAVIALTAQIEVKKLKSRC